MHLDYERVVVVLNRFKNPPFGHDLHNFVISLDPIFSHYLHCIKLTCDLVPYQEHLRETTLPYDLLNDVESDVLPVCYSIQPSPSFY